VTHPEELPLLPTPFVVSAQRRCTIFYLLYHIFTVPLLCLDMFRCTSTGQWKCDGTCAETIFRLSLKQTIPFQSAGASVQLTTGCQGVRIIGSNAGYAMFRGSVTGTGYSLHLPVSLSPPLPCITVCHHISTGVYLPLCYNCLQYWA